MSSKKLKDLRERLEKNVIKRDEMSESIKKIEAQINEEEAKEFRMVMEEQELSFDEALARLKQLSKKSVNATSPSSRENVGAVQGHEEGNHATTI